MEKFTLTFQDVLEQLAKDKGKLFQGKNFKKGVVLKAGEFGFIQQEIHYEDCLSTHVSNYVVSTKTADARFREIFNKNELFEDH